MQHLSLSRALSALPHGRSLPPHLWRSRHRALVLLLCAHAALLPLWAALWDHPLEHALEGSVALAALAALGASAKRRSVASGFVSVGLVAASALIVHLGNGHTFLHFHFFFVVAALALYQDWEPFVIALGVVLAEHGVLAVVARHDVYDDPWSQQHPFGATAIHGGYVLAAAVASIVNWRWSETERERAQRQAQTEATRVRDSERRLAELIDNTPSLVFVKDLNGRIVRVNPRFAELHERSAEELIGRTKTELLHDGEPPLNESDVAVLETRGAVEHEAVFDFPSGPRTMHVVKFPLKGEDGEPYAIAGILTDITERARAEQALLHQTLHDELTDLPNRRHLRQTVNRALAEGHTVGLAFFDLDGFKEVNDSLGHDIGDALLCEVAVRLSNACAVGERLFRLGGDEFVMFRTTTDAAAVERSARRLLDALGDPFTIDGVTLDVAGSSGVAVGSQADGTTMSTLLRDADTALYEAKDTSRGALVVFDPSLRDRDERRRRLQVDLRAALHGTPGLHLQYQPIALPSDGRTVIVEALVRWQHPDEGLLSPAEFLPVAAHAGSLPDLDHWVIDQACQQRAQWKAQGVDVAISINVTPETLSQGNLVTWVVESARRHGTPLTALVLELTETAVLEHPDAASTTLAALRDLGARVALDDFGTGYSSLSLLRDLPVDIVKIDRSFVHRIQSHTADQVIVQATSDLAHALGMLTVAEGVETKEERDAAVGLGCDLLQGWYLAKPLAPEDLAARIPAPRSATSDVLAP